MKLTPDITLIPYLHGKIFFARHVRDLCLKQSFDCYAVDIPSVFEAYITEAVEMLPQIHAIIARTLSGETFYLPTDPCDASIEIVRQSCQNHTPVHCIGSPVLRQNQPIADLPDEYAGKTLDFDIYSALCLYTIGNRNTDTENELECQYIANRILDLKTKYSNIFVLVHFRSFIRVISHLQKEKTCNLSFENPPLPEIVTRRIHPDHLYFALGELPFITGKYERERHDIFSEPFDVIESIKDLFRETRDEYFDDREDIVTLSPVRIQTALTFLRNLTVMSGRLLPSLLDIIEAAKGVGGNSYAVRILKSAKYYPYIQIEDTSSQVHIGIDKIQDPELGTTEAINIFRDTAVQWRTISIKPDPSLEKKKQYRYTWNPYGMCSHVPEDLQIENFNSYVRQKALKIMVEDLVRTEKFSSSVKDGIDIRETLRNWHSGEIYVKEIPASRGNVDTVVIIFDHAHDWKYPHLATWYAEHKEESTLSFYSTDPMGNLIGPGIAQCTYGGLALLFPPRQIPNVFDITETMDLPDLAARLTYGALLFSQERVVAYIADRKPGAVLKKLASKLKKHLLWVPIQTFSNETLRRLRKFHILNGKDVRSWAGRYIGD